MIMLEEKLQKHIDLLMKRYPVLETCKEEIIGGYEWWKTSYSRKWRFCC